MKGIVKHFNNEKGWGFISVEGEDDIFVHYTGIAANGYKTLKKGQEVTFDTEKRDKGLIAVNVKPI